MRIGAKYKIARRLGPEIFDKTQSQKYAIATARKLQRQMKTMKHPRVKTEYGTQMLAKQKVRFMYGILERQFAKYVKNALLEKGHSPSQKLFETIEMRLDNVVYRLGLSVSRRSARQMVSHGHITVDGRKITIPSYKVDIGNLISVRVGSSGSVLFKDFSDKLKTPVPAWLKAVPEKKSWEIVGPPRYVPSETMIDLGAVIEFYSR